MTHDVVYNIKQIIDLQSTTRKLLIQMYQYRKWTKDSWEWFSHMTLTDMAAETGNQLVPGYFFTNKVLFVSTRKKTRLLS